MIHSFLLKVIATVLTLATAAAAAVHVSGNVKNPSASLHPQVLGPGPPAVGTAPGGGLTLTPAVKTSDVQPITSTHSS